MNVYIVAGQSNALGISPISGLDKDLLSGCEVLIFQNSNTRIPFANKLVKVKLGLGLDETKFGLEVGVSLQLQKEGADAVIIKYASDGTSLYDRWRADGARGEDFVNLISTIKAGLATLKSEKNSITLKGFLWMQGENDASYLEQASEYHDNLKNFICAIRDIFARDLPFVVGQTNSNNKILKYVDAVNLAQKNVAQELDNVFFVDTSDLNELIDNYHYSAKCELELGARMVKTLLKNT